MHSLYENIYLEENKSSRYYYGLDTPIGIILAALAVTIECAIDNAAEK
jgi:hypothetical protein